MSVLLDLELFWGVGTLSFLFTIAFFMPSQVCRTKNSNRTGTSDAI